ncbi:acyl-CoA carboxylase subunit epsilon [Curtobacterium flaccumfaciens]|uniref:Acyl-CoA carboxylase subunit epsilon n=2 Tax=Microbacteriaceae TaxID=85023 RepID=A0A9Q9P7R5_9MICO|nr:acyl-CoA carboxylase subunit epsilon [Curtobacterium flaccumfaciens]UXN25409.1 acyl-CoA carboxylase subunit epsilon [Curtobacterium flaccumfaciens]UYC80247.1 acyl-CoA carboxylase subunit epsilon [Curtobacterium flaccumfaciens pv. poinsettiae]
MEPVESPRTGSSRSRGLMGRHAAAVPSDEPASVADVRVVSGDPSPEELAAVVAVLQRQADEAAAAGRAAVVVEPRTGWDAAARGLRRPLDHGPGAWGRSLR